MSSANCLRYKINSNLFYVYFSLLFQLSIMNRPRKQYFKNTEEMMDYHNRLMEFHKSQNQDESGEESFEDSDGSDQFENQEESGDETIEDYDASDDFENVSDNISDVEIESDEEINTKVAKD